VAFARFPLAALWLCALLSSPASAAQWRTADGLEVSLRDADGAVVGVTLDGRALPLSEEPGGLLCQEYTIDPNAPERAALHVEAEGDGWCAASFADWQATGDYVRAGTEADRRYLQIGDGKSPGVGMAATRRMDVAAGDEMTISWLGRTHDIALSYIVCLRVFARDGADITATAPAPQGWTYSPYSKAHYRSDLGHAKADTWERLTCGYTVPEGAAAAQLSVRVYRDGDLRADVDDIRVTVKAGGVWSAPLAVTGPVETAADGAVQKGVLPSLGLAFTVRYVGEAERLGASVEVADTRGQGPRCLRLIYRLPLALANWTWSADPRSSRSISRPVLRTRTAWASPGIA